MFKRNQIFVHCSNNEILFLPRVANVNILFMPLANYHKHCKYHRGSVWTELMQLLLDISGNEELNPWPQTPKYLYEECGNAVTINNIACNNYNTWYHRGCAGINLTIFKSYARNSEMEWECTQCGMPNISISIFDSTISSRYSSSTDSGEIKPKSKAKPLRIVTPNFQSMFKGETCHFLNDYHIGIMIGCENHLSSSVPTSELLPLYIQHTGVIEMMVM